MTNVAGAGVYHLRRPGGRPTELWPGVYCGAHVYYDRTMGTPDDVDCNACLEAYLPNCSKCGNESTERYEKGDDYVLFCRRCRRAEAHGAEAAALLREVLDGVH